jgi:hypothetical protein
MWLTFYQRKSREGFSQALSCEACHLLIGDDPVVLTDDSGNATRLQVCEGLFACDEDTAGVAVGVEDGLNGDGRDPKQEVLKRDVGFNRMGEGVEPRLVVGAAVDCFVERVQLRWRFLREARIPGEAARTALVVDALLQTVNKDVLGKVIPSGAIGDLQSNNWELCQIFNLSSRS